MLFLSIASLCALGACVVAFDPEEAKVLQHLYETIPRQEFIEYFNNQKYSFKIAHYEHLEGRHPSQLACVPSNRTLHNFPTISHDPELFKNLPENFDARTNWPQCETINDVFDQGRCGSCWTFGSATTASDRMCIHQNKNVRLSEQDLQCCTICQPNGNVCGGGWPEHAFNFWVSIGLVTQQCKPYYEPELHQPSTCRRTCNDPRRNYDQDKNRGLKVYSVLSDENSIKSELFTNGPIQATFNVYEDFSHYRGGVYVHQFGNLLSPHSVRVIGYGVEGGIPYWLGVNSWGQRWGINGLFKIQRYTDAEFENRLFTGY